MIEELPPLSPQARALLDRERPVPSLTSAVRARALARARATLAAVPVPVPLPRPVAPAWLRWAAAAALTVAVGTAAAAAYQHSVRPAPRSEPSEAYAASAPPPAALPQPEPVALVVPPALPPAEVDAPAGENPKRARTVVPREELRLLKQARAAVAREDFAGALGPIAEHARRFKDGRLIEEREALRVKALVGLGRRAEAGRAATSFEARFPKSVLLPTVRRISSGAR